MSIHALKQAARDGEEEGGGEGHDLVCGVDRQLCLRSVGTHAGHCGTHPGFTVAGRQTSVVLGVHLWWQYAWVGDAGGWLSGMELLGWHGLLG